MRTFKKVVSLLLMLTLTVFAGSCATYHYEGAAAGAAVGGIGGAFIDKENPWRGGVIGAALGAVFGATLADLSARGAKEAAETGEPVEYMTADGRSVYRAEPREYDAKTKCRKVQERVWEDDKLVKDEIKEVCESEKREGTYLGEEARGGYVEREYDYDYPPPPREPGYERDYEYGGPPPWAPAHGYRAKYRYRYYPSSYVYFGEDMGLYYYYYAGRWEESPILPANIYLDVDYVMLEMDADRPYEFHRDVVKRYPPGFKENIYKGPGYY